MQTKSKASKPAKSFHTPPHLPPPTDRNPELVSQIPNTATSWKRWTCNHFSSLWHLESQDYNCERRLQAMDSRNHGLSSCSSEGTPQVEIGPVAFKNVGWEEENAEARTQAGRVPGSHQPRWCRKWVAWRRTWTKTSTTYGYTVLLVLMEMRSLFVSSMKNTETATIIVGKSVWRRIYCTTGCFGEGSEGSCTILETSSCLSSVLVSLQQWVWEIL